MLSYLVALSLPLAILIFAIAVNFPFGAVVFENDVTLDVIQHLSLHAVFYGPAAALLVSEFVLAADEQKAFGVAVKLAGVLASGFGILIGWLCGYRLKQLEHL